MTSLAYEQNAWLNPVDRSANSADAGAATERSLPSLGPNSGITECSPYVSEGMWQQFVEAHGVMGPEDTLAFQVMADALYAIAKANKGNITTATYDRVRAAADEFAALFLITCPKQEHQPPVLPPAVNIFTDGSLYR